MPGSVGYMPLENMTLEKRNFEIMSQMTNEQLHKLMEQLAGVSLHVPEIEKTSDTIIIRIKKMGVKVQIKVTEQGVIM